MEPISATELAGRALKISLELARFGLRAGLRARPVALGGEGGAGWRSSGAQLADLLEDLGPTFIKLGQIASTRPDLVPPGIVAGLSRLQDRLRPVPMEALRASIEASISAPIASKFSHVDPVPLSSASIAQVHAGRTSDGRQVALKVRRPGVRRTVTADLRLLGLLARIAQRLPPLRLVPVEAVMAEFAAAIEAQLDFDRELGNQRRLLATFDGIEGIEIPAPVEELCGPDLITMELIEQTAKLDELEDPGRRRRAALLAVRAIYRMIFVDGTVHADMHPGNLLFRADGGCVLVDFGLVARLEGPVQKDFLDFFYGMVVGDGRECARVIWDTAVSRTPTADEAGFVERVSGTVAKYHGRNAREFEVTGIAVELFDAQRSSGVRGSADFMMTIVALIVLEGVAKQLDPELDFQGEARQFVPAARGRLFPRRPW